MSFVERKPIFTFYGDDFTGSTDALEALALNGIRAVLFLDIPGDKQLNQFRDCDAIGVAGESRSRSPEWMSANLPRVFSRLKQIGGAICQYKICSTFDSSPELGSIGRAILIGSDVFQSRFVPVFPAAPKLQRYVVFGNLFAAGGSCVYRIDRHPTMSRHPVTPMTESDLRLHLARQTKRQIDGFDIVSLEHPGFSSEFDQLLERGSTTVLFDGLTEESVRRSSGLIWERRSSSPFVIGSSGFTHGLAECLRSKNLPHESASFTHPGDSNRLIVLSGSCSPNTAVQIHWALANGFAGLKIDPATLLDSRDSAKRNLLAQALTALQASKGLVLYSALGPGDCNSLVPRDELASEMGCIFRELLVRSGIKRAVLAGGDTSTHAGRQLRLNALTIRAPLTPGAPLCEAHSDERELQGLQLVLKGGQIGPEDFFAIVQRGSS